MALFRRKLFRRVSPSQLVVRFASRGLPWPLRWILGTRFVSKIIFLLVLGLLAIGVLTLDWSDGWPSFSIDRQRATEVGNAAKQLANDVRDRIPERVTDTIREGIPDSLGLDRWSSVIAPQQPAGPPSQVSVGVPSRGATSSTIRLASFNIQVLGETKAGQPEVMRVLASVVRQFDIIAIQELRTMQESVIEGFLALVNADGGSYRSVVGPRLGRTVSKEQYVFIYDSSRLDVDPQSIFTVPDPQDYLHREPTIARFQVRSTSTQPGFSFILANIHTDPDETDTELDALADVFVSLQRNNWQEDDVILLGDLNVSYEKLGRLGRLPNIAYTVHGEPTNTRGTKSYDNIVFDRLATSEFTGVTGIVSLQQEFGLSMEQAIDVSDHLPIWAEFDAHEHGTQSPLAVQPYDAPTSYGQARIVENPLLRLPGYQR